MQRDLEGFEGFGGLEGFEGLGGSGGLEDYGGRMDARSSHTLDAEGGRRIYMYICLENRCVHIYGPVR